jgi:multisubunit Na+/H+ antiporter MnhE subunit
LIKGRLKSIVVMTILLFIFWLIMAEFASISEWWVGLLASLLVVAFLRNALIEKEDLSPLRLFQGKLLFLFFIYWLKDLWVANVEVAKIVLRKKMDIDPQFYTLKQPLKRRNFKR